MPSDLVRQRSFVGGEISPLRYGAIDSPAYQRGLRTALNFIPTLEGQLLNRPGTKWVGSALNDVNFGRLFAFSFADGQNLMLEVGGGTIRFIKDGAFVLAAGVPYFIGAPWAWADLPRLDASQSGDVITFTCIGPTNTEYPPYELTRISNTNWTLAVASYVPHVYFGQQVTQPGPGTKVNKVQQSNLYLVPKDGNSAPLWDAGTAYGVTVSVCYTSADGWKRQYTALKDVPAGNQPDQHPEYWALHSIGSTAGVNGGPYAKGDFAYFVGILLVSLQDHNPWQPPNSIATVTVPGGGTFTPAGPENPPAWALAIDELHPAQNDSIQITQVWKDSLGDTHETLPCDTYLSPVVDGTFPIATDRLPTYQWGAPDNAAAPAGYVLDGHYVYRGKFGGVFGRIGATDATTFTFQDNGAAPDFGHQPPKGTNPWDVATGAATKTQSYPRAVTHHEQRILYGGSLKRPQDIDGSAIGDFHRFDINTPQQDEDACRFRPGAEKLCDVRGLLSMEHLIILTGGGVFSARGPAGEITPTGIFIRRAAGLSGSSYLQPLNCDRAGLFFSSRNRIRDLQFDYRSDKYISRDVSVVARHLFEHNTLVDWTYAETPYGLVYGVRDDGVLLTLTYASDGLDSGVEAFARMTTRGRFGAVAACEETDPVTGQKEDAVYVEVKRIIDGATKIYIERFSSRLLPKKATTSADDGTISYEDDVRFCNFLDCAIEYDGRQAATAPDGNPNGLYVDSVSNPNSNNPVDYAPGKQITVSARVATPFTADMKDTAAVVFDPDNVNGDGPITADIIGFTNSGLVTCELVQQMTQAQVSFWTNHEPAGVFGATPWGIAASIITGLDHLNGQSVNVLGDGAVSGPYNVEGGSITLGTPAVIAQVGIPYNSDMELLDIGSDSAAVNQKMVRKLWVQAAQSRGLLGGETFDLDANGESQLDDLAPISVEDVISGGVAPPLKTEWFEVPIRSDWNLGGTAVIRQSDPLPLAITSVVREVILGGR